MSTISKHREPAPTDRVHPAVALGVVLVLAAIAVWFLVPEVRDGVREALPGSSDTVAAGPGRPGVDPAGDPGGDPTTDPVTGTPGETPAATPTPGAGATTRTPGKKGPTVPTATDLDPLVLRGADLPLGWRPLPEVGEATERLMGACLRKALSTATPHVARTEAFRRGSDGPVLSSSMLGFATDKAADQAYQGFRSAVTGCSSSGGSLEVRPGNSDAARFTLELTFRQGTAAARGKLIGVRLSRYVNTVMVVGGTTDDLEVGEDATDVVVTRLLK